MCHPFFSSFPVIPLLSIINKHIKIPLSSGIFQIWLKTKDFFQTINNGSGRYWKGWRQSWIDHLLLIQYVFINKYELHSSSEYLVWPELTDSYQSVSALLKCLRGPVMELWSQMLCPSNEETSKVCCFFSPPYQHDTHMCTVVKLFFTWVA